ncbi:MAG TPA: M50 family metallopeptidase [Pyrinomonadaceae bacterium]|jgi:hypothetical protein
MKYKVAENSRPQLTLLIVATLISIGLWLISKYFFPSLSFVVYPLQLFATFIHEGSHVLASVLTGGSVESLTVSWDTSGEVYSVPSGFFGQLLTSSAGYLGTTAFGTALLIWMRYGFSSRKALYFSSAFIALMTVVFGLLAPALNIFSVKVTFGSVLFTVFSGAILSAGLFALARFGSLKWVNFGLAFLAVQCLLNAIFSLVDLFFISVMTDQLTDAGNMAKATGVPSVIWVFLWIGISILMISVGLRFYAASQKSKQHDLPFED